MTDNSRPLAIGDIVTAFGLAGKLVRFDDLGNAVVDIDIAGIEAVFNPINLIKVGESNAQS